MRHASGKKALRQSLARRVQNNAVRNRVRTLTANVLRDIAAKNADAAKAGFKEAQSAWQRAAQRGIVTANAASRKISRLSARLASLATSK
ncbi:MAG: 30S ribosomal protein S20 [Elusimicrobia bacterium]|nr:30S ribosomal protein S20 [Elusimicrobiota bacterium]